MTKKESLNAFPVPLLLVNAIGALMMAGGVTGLLAPDTVPALARPVVAYSLLGVGLLLDVAALAAILKTMTKARRATPAG